MPHCVLLTKGRQKSLKTWFWCFVSNKCFAAYDSILTAFLLCSNFLKWVGKLQSHCNSSRITSAFNHASLRKPGLGWWCLSMAQKSVFWDLHYCLNCIWFQIVQCFCWRMRNHGGNHRAGWDTRSRMCQVLEFSFLWVSLLRLMSIHAAFCGIAF